MLIHYQYQYFYLYYENNDRIQPCIWQLRLRYLHSLLVTVHIQFCECRNFVCTDSIIIITAAVAFVFVPPDAACHHHHLCSAPTDLLCYFYIMISERGTFLNTQGLNIFTFYKLFLTIMPSFYQLYFLLKVNSSSSSFTHMLHNFKSTKFSLINHITSPIVTLLKRM